MDHLIYDSHSVLQPQSSALIVQMLQVTSELPCLAASPCQLIPTPHTLSQPPPEDSSPSGALHMCRPRMPVASSSFPAEDSSFKSFSPKTQMDGLLGRALMRNKCFEHVALTYKGKYKHLEFFHCTTAGTFTAAVSNRHCD